MHVSGSKFSPVPVHHQNRSEHALCTYHIAYVRTANCLLDDMDKQLLLSLQSVCNDKGVKLPWDDVGAAMHKQVSSGAIIQHLAKLRQRLAAQGVSVPPPLRRGGGNGISTSGNRNVGSGTPATPKKTNSAANANSENNSSGSEDEECDVDKASDSEEEFGSWRAEQNATKARGRKPKVKEADGSEIKQEDDDAANKTGTKRKSGRNSGGPHKRKRGPAKRKFQKRKNSKSDRRAPSSVSNTKESGSSDDEIQSGSDDSNQQDPVGQRYLAVGAGIFRDYDQDNASNPRESDSEGPKTANLVAVLRLGKNERAQAFLQSLHNHEQALHKADADSIARSEITSIAKFDGGGEVIPYGKTASPNVADVDYQTLPPETPPRLIQEYARRLPRASLSYESASIVANTHNSSVMLGNDNLRSGRNATHDSLAFYHPNSHPSGRWDFGSMPVDFISPNVAAPAGYSAHTGQQTNLGAFPSSDLHPDDFNFPSSYANNFGQGSGWFAPPAFDHNESQKPHGVFVRPLDGYSNESYRNIPLPASSPEDVNIVNMFGHESAVSAGQTCVAPTNLFKNNIGTSPGSIENSFAQVQDSLSGYTQQVRGSAAIKSDSPAGTSGDSFPWWDSFPPNNDSAVQVSGIENSEDVNWTNLLVDFDGAEDISDINFMNDSGKSKGAAGVEE